MKNVFPWNKDSLDQLLKGFAGNTAFSVTWHWAPFHETGFRALKWAVEKKLTTAEFYKILDNLSCPSAPKQVKRRLQRAKLTDHIDRVLPLDPSISIKRTFILAEEKIEKFENETVLLTIDELLKINPEIEKLWKPFFTEDKPVLERWLTRDQSLLNSFHTATPWHQLKIIESLVGPTKPSTTLNFQRIY